MKELLMFLTLSLISINLFGQCDRQRDSMALVALYNLTDGPNWGLVWDFNEPMDEWFLVTLNSSGCVERLDFSIADLTGTLPPEIGDLTELVHLDLSGSSLTGSLPPEIGDLKKLSYLNLYGNELEGSLPGPIKNLSSLTHLDLTFNLFSGELGPQIAELKELRHLNLSVNDISGNIPPELGQLENLQYLNMKLNDIEGSIPLEFSELVNLETLDLSSNYIREIPPEFAKLSRLKYLNLEFNEIYGEFPQAFLELDSIQEIIIFNNKLTGFIPEELGDLEFLRHLSVSRNRMTGCFPDFVCSLDQFHANNNFRMPWEGDVDPFCVDGLDQVGAPCIDGDPDTENEEINEDCECTVPNSNHEINSQGITIFPNPFLDRIYVDVSSSQIEKLEIYNQLGQLMQIVNLTTEKNEVPLEQLRPGMYFTKTANGFHDILIKK